MTDPILKIENLEKSYRSSWSFKKIPALNINYVEVAEGSAFGYLGENGAGKTTTIKCILNLIKRDNGRILFQNKDLLDNKYNDKIGYLPELPYFYDHLSVRETLKFYATLNNIKGRELKTSVDHTISLLKLENKSENSVSSLSKGQKQRLGFAQAIINKPILLILDEPFSGLDPIGRIEVKNLILELKQNGTTIFMSSHILNDVEEICDRVCFIKSGKIIKSFQIKDIPQIFPSVYSIKFLTKDAQDKTQYLEFEKQSEAQYQLEKLLSNGNTILEFKINTPNLEELFLKITA